MARTTAIKQKPLPARQIVYKEYSITKDGDSIFVIKGKRKIKARNKAHAMEIIDGFTEQAIRDEFPRGGFTPNPPDNCEYRQKLEKGGSYWVENVVCAFKCNNKGCSIAMKLHTEGRRRISALNYKQLNKVCPYCSSDKINNEDIYEPIVAYVCTTTGDRRTGSYEKKCGRKRTKGGRL